MKEGFLVHIIQNQGRQIFTENYTKTGKNIPRCHKIYQIAVNYSKLT
jgi:hypothetical protein